MSPLRERMIDEMCVDNVARFAGYFNKSSDQLGRADVQAYLLHLVQGKR